MSVKTQKRREPEEDVKEERKIASAEIHISVLVLRIHDNKVLVKKQIN